MSLSEADAAFAQDLFSDLEDLTSRKMFGGMCLYSRGTVFALIDSAGQLYLKAKDPIAQALRDQGAAQFHNMPYWSLPPALLDDPQEACTLARRTLATLE